LIIKPRATGRGWDILLASSGLFMELPYFFAFAGRSSMIAWASVTIFANTTTGSCCIPPLSAMYGLAGTSMYAVGASSSPLSMRKAHHRLPCDAHDPVVCLDEPPALPWGL